MWRIQHGQHDSDCVGLDGRSVPDRLAPCECRGVGRPLQGWRDLWLDGGAAVHTHWTRHLLWPIGRTEWLHGRRECHPADRLQVLLRVFQPGKSRASSIPVTGRQDGWHDFRKTYSWQYQCADVRLSNTTVTPSTCVNGTGMVASNVKVGSIALDASSSTSSAAAGASASTSAVTTSQTSSAGPASVGVLRSGVALSFAVLAGIASISV